MNTTDTLVDEDIRGPLTRAERDEHGLEISSRLTAEVDHLVTEGIMPGPDNATALADTKASLIFMARAERRHKSSPVERVSDGHGPYSIGSDLWPGLSKVAEESGEIIQVIGKLMGTGGLTAHWDGTDLAVRMQEEIADLQAALEFLIAHTPEHLDRDAIETRTAKKLALFEKWHADAAAPVQVSVSDAAIPPHTSKA